MPERRIKNIADKIAIHERMATVETNIETIMTNHLPHIEASIKELREETKTNIDGLGSRFDAALKNSGENTDRKLGSIDKKFWAIIILLISALVGIITTLAIK